MEPRKAVKTQRSDMTYNGTEVHAWYGSTCRGKAIKGRNG